MAMMMVMLRMMVMGIYDNDNDNKYNNIDIINNLTVTLVIRDNNATYKNEDNYSVFKTRNRTQHMLYLRKSSTS